MEKSGERIAALGSGIGTLFADEETIRVNRTDALSRARNQELYSEFVWDHRVCRSASPRQKSAQASKWKRNEEMLAEFREGTPVPELAKKHNLSERWTAIIVEREGRLQDTLSCIPTEKKWIFDLGPFRWRTGTALYNAQLIYIPIEEFHASQNAKSLLALPNFGLKSLHELALCLRWEGYDISKFKLPQPALAWIGEEPNAP